MTLPIRVGQRWQFRNPTAHFAEVEIIRIQQESKWRFTVDCKSHWFMYRRGDRGDYIDSGHDFTNQYTFDPKLNQLRRRPTELADDDLVWITYDPPST